jgi:lipoprotein-anchoring transpeptidase ErfK/SrfK
VRRLVGTVATAVLACALAGPATASPARPLERDGGSLLAHVELPSAVRAAPDPRARAIGRVTGRTAWSYRREALMVTGLRRGRDGRRWVRVQLPVRPNGTAGWVPRRAVRLSVVRVRVVVDRSARRLEVWRGGRRLHSWRAGVGRPGTPTPVGVFAVQDPMRTLPAWRGVYGGWTLTLTAHSEVLRSFMGGDGLVAIHGGSLGRVGRPASNGCVILSEPHLATLARLVRPGTPVEIRD